MDSNRSSISQLVDFLDNEVLIEDKEQLKEEIELAVKENRFLTLYDDLSQPCGFLTWLRIQTQEGDWVYLSNCYIDKDKRNKVNLYEIRKFFKKMFPNLDMIYWARDFNGQDKFHYMKEGAI